MRNQRGSILTLGKSGHPAFGSTLFVVCPQGNPLVQGSPTQKREERTTPSQLIPITMSVLFGAPNTRGLQVSDALVSQVRYHISIPINFLPEVTLVFGMTLIPSPKGN